MSFPKKGKFFPSQAGRYGSNAGGGPPDETCFAVEIAAALRRALGSTHAGIKIAGRLDRRQRTNREKLVFRALRS